jgi:hypothetical protein
VSAAGRRIVATAAVALACTVAVHGAAYGAARDGGHGALPPASRAELVKLFRGRLEPLGLRITRAALVDADNERSADGTHLALYVEPSGAYSDADYLDGVAAVSRLFLPGVFRRWPGLRSFDVCQEPKPADDTRAEPPPETQVFVLKQGVDRVAWKTADLAELLAAAADARAGRGETRVDLSVFVASHLREHPRYRDALEKSRPSSPDAPASSGTYR